MFLSKRNGIYYLWYDAENGRRRKVSTHATAKVECCGWLLLQKHGSAGEGGEDSTDQKFSTKFDPAPAFGGGK